MTAQIFRAFAHEHNRLGAAEQDYALACQEYERASAVFDSLDKKSVERFRHARERRSAAYDQWWALRRGD